MDLTEIRKLIRIMLGADLSELELDDTKRGVRVRLKRDTGHGERQAALPSVVQVVPSGVSGAPGAAVAPGASAGAPVPGGEVYKSPIVGTFYRSASPDAEPFVKAGSAFTEGTVLCIIEAMKVMNEIRAEFAGEIVEVLAENGEPVEFGQPLFLIKKG